jgi:hypothetical protein
MLRLPPVSGAMLSTAPLWRKVRGGIQLLHNCITFTNKQQTAYRKTFIEECRQKAWGPRCHVEWISKKLDETMVHFTKLQEEDRGLHSLERREAVKQTIGDNEAVACASDPNVFLRTRKLPFQKKAQYLVVASTRAMIATEMPAVTRPYSIAFVSFRNRPELITQLHHPAIATVAAGRCRRRPRRLTGTDRDPLRYSPTNPVYRRNIAE